MSNNNNNIVRLVVTDYPKKKKKKKRLVVTMLNNIVRIRRHARTYATSANTYSCVRKYGDEAAANFIFRITNTKSQTIKCY